MLNVLIQSVKIMSVILLSVRILSVILLCIVMFSDAILSVVVIMQKVIILWAWCVMLGIAMLIVILISQYNEWHFAQCLW